MLQTKSARTILESCMGLKSNESCLIIADSASKRIGDMLYQSSLKIAKSSKLILTRIPKFHGCEPQKLVADEMLKHDVILMPTTKSLSHTKARENASRKGARIASMPGITKDMMERALDVDFKRIRNINNKLALRLKSCREVRIESKGGTNASFFLKGRKWLKDDGIYTKKGSFGNLPAGEIFIAPLESKTCGTIIVDASIGGIGRVDRNVKIEIKRGYISRVYGGKAARAFEKSLKNALYRNVAELGIGTNYRAIITGNVLEDEKAAGTCHVAFGNSAHFGGKVDVPFHVDVVVRKLKVYADGVLVKEL